MSKKFPQKPKPSIFARILIQLLDDANFYTRAEWGRFLGISEPAISQWVNDRTLPRADLLRMVVDVLRTRGGVAAGEGLMALDAIMDDPADMISPLGARLGPTLRSYLKIRSIGEIGRSMREAIEGGAAIPTQPTVETGLVTPDAVPAAAAMTVSLPTRAHGLGPAWRMPRLLRAEGAHGRERQVSVDDLAAAPRIVLMGSVGSGKTAFLNFLHSQHPRWRRSESLSLRNLSTEALEGWLNARRTASPKVPLIIDGLDEMPLEVREQATAKLVDFTAHNADAPILIASRPVSELERLSAFECFSIAPLSDVDLVAEITRSSLASRCPVEVDRFLCHLTERETLRPALRNHLFLQIAWSLFENKAVTPFAESVILKEYMHVLFERDHIQGFSRIREPWASSQGLFRILGEISLNLLRSEESAFDEHRLAQWIKKPARDVPVDKLLDLLLVLGVLAEDDEKYYFSHRVFPEYFAAHYVIDSAASAAEYFRLPHQRSRMDGAMRMACSLASDATPLLEAMMSASSSSGRDFILLAQILAQPIEAEPEILADSCRMLVAWLNEQTAGWELVDEEHETADSSARWHVCAHVRQQADTEAVAGTLRAIHQARSGPACAPLRTYLKEAHSSFLPVFSDAMEVEGRLKVSFGHGNLPSGDARVAVEHLQLA